VTKNFLLPFCFSRIKTTFPSVCNSSDIFCINYVLNTASLTNLCVDHNVMAVTNGVFSVSQRFIHRWKAGKAWNWLFPALHCRGLESEVKCADLSFHATSGKLLVLSTGTCSGARWLLRKIGQGSCHWMAITECLQVPASLTLTKCLLFLSSGGVWWDPESILTWWRTGKVISLLVGRLTSSKWSLLSYAFSTHTCGICTTSFEISLVDFQLDAQNSYLFTYNTFIKILFMFRALPCSIFRRSTS
jgi:hypothetical protein